MAKIKTHLGEAETPDMASPPTEPTKKRSAWEEAGRQLGLTARAGATAVAGVPAMLADPLVAGINAVAGRQVFPNQTQELQRKLTELGLPEPQGGLERAVQTGATAMGGAGTQAAVAAASKLPMLAPLAREVPQQLAAAGAAGSAAQATADYTQEAGRTPLETAAASLAVGALAGMTAAKGVRMAGTEKVPQMTMEDVKRQASRAYERVDAAGINVKPQPLLRTIDDIEADLVRTSNFNPLLESHRPVKTVLDQLRAMVGSQRVSFSKLDQLRQAANNIARESTDPATRRLAGQVVEGLDKKIGTLQPTDLITGKTALPSALKDVKEARDAWRRVSKAGILEDALDVSATRALDPKASQGELIRNQFKVLAANKNKMRMFNSDEQAAIKRVVSGDGVEALLALLARMNPERSHLVMGGQLFMGYHNPVAGAAAAGTGFAADKALGALQQSRAQDAVSRVLSGYNTPRPESMWWRAPMEARPRMAEEEQR
jgi:hypothetical protein